MPNKRSLSMSGLLLGLLLALIIGGCAGQSNNSGSGFESAYRRDIQPYRFNFVSWERDTFMGMLKNKLSGKAAQSDDNSQVVLNYFQTISKAEQLDNQSRQARATDRGNTLPDLERQRAALRSQLDAHKHLIEKILSQQISLELAESGIYNPVSNNWLKITFPPLSFKLESSLSVLVVSPRHKIERMRETIIRPDITSAEIDRLEASIERNDVSALVIPLGGLGATYPSYVIESSDLKYSLAVIAEEWLHQYMAFRPLGFRYVLELTGIINDPHIAALNETVVGIAAQEIGELVYQRYYAAYYPAGEPPAESSGTPVFDFNSTMREIRLNVDAWLAAGQVEKAENYMEQQRQALVSRGYYIRKLNQAYFAFHGSYAYQGTSVDPMGEQVKQLRNNSSSLQQYIETASGITSRKSLQNLLTRHQVNNPGAIP